MKSIMITMFTCLSFSIKSSATMPTLAEVRQLYQSAVTDKSCCAKLINLLSDISVQSNALMLGYAGCANMLEAKYVFSPFSKMDYFAKGKGMLEKAISMDSTNAELRYLRYGVQTNAPSFLGYHNQIKDDKRFLINALKNISDTYLEQSIVAVLKKNDYVTKEEK